MMATADYVPERLTTAQAQNCVIPYWDDHYRYGTSTSMVYSITPADVWCVRVDGDTYLFRSELDALRWLVRHMDAGASVFRAKYERPLGEQ